MTEPLAPDVAPVLQADAQGRLTVHLTCVGGGYNLRGLRVADLCPECATPLGKSTEGRWLRFAEPQWLNAIARGATLLVAAALVGLGWRYGLYAMELFLLPSQPSQLSMARP